MTGIEIATIGTTALTVGDVALAAGTILGTAGMIQQGNAAKAQGEAQRQVAEFEAAQRERIAGQERAAAQREAIIKRKEADLVASRGQAVAAASGAGALDPTIVDLLGDIEGEGEYRAALALYQGEERAIGQETAASARRFEGRAANAAGTARRNAAYMGSGGTFARGISKLDIDLGGTGAPPTSAGSSTLAGAPINRSMWSRYG